MNLGSWQPVNDIIKNSRDKKVHILTETRENVKLCDRTKYIEFIEFIEYNLLKKDGAKLNG